MSRRPTEAKQTDEMAKPSVGEIVAVFWVVGVCALFVRMALQAVFVR